MYSKNKEAVVKELAKFKLKSWNIQDTLDISKH